MPKSDPGKKTPKLRQSFLSAVTSLMLSLGRADNEASDYRAKKDKPPFVDRPADPETEAAKAAADALLIKKDVAPKP